MCPYFSYPLCRREFVICKAAYYTLKQAQFVSSSCLLNLTLQTPRTLGRELQSKHQSLTIIPRRPIHHGYPGRHTGRLRMR